MGIRPVIIVVLLAAAQIQSPAPVAAQHRMSGRVAADVGAYGFANNVGDTLDVDADRRLSSQYLDFDLSGPLVDGYFANYLATMKLSGVQVRASSEGESTTEYIKPDITHYFGALSFFPNRNFPLRLYTGKTDDQTVRYEAANRSKIDNVDPGLAVVRRYRKQNEGTGGIWQFYPNKGVEFATEYKSTRDQSTRQYDFDENRNVWVQYSVVREALGPFYVVKVQNTIEDRAVRVFIDGFDVGTAPADGELDLLVEGGLHALEFIPEGLNSFRDAITVDKEMIWKVIFSEPPGSKDLDNNNDVFNARLRLGDTGPLRNETFFEWDDGYEAVQRNDNDLLVFFNDADYLLSPTVKLRSKTDYTDTKKDIEDVSFQKTSSFKQETSGTWQTRKGPGARLSHTYTMTDAINDDIQIVSKKNQIAAIYSMPTNWNAHRVSVGTNADLLTDSDGNENNTLTTNLSNELAFWLGGLLWNPKHDLKRVAGRRNNPDVESRELSSRFVLDGMRAQLGPFGKLALQGIHDWRRRQAGVLTDVTTKYTATVDVSRAFSHRYRLGGGISFEKEVYDTAIEDAGGAPPDVQVRPAENQRAIKFDFAVEPWPGYSLTMASRFVKTNDADNRNFSALLSLIIPGLKIPFTTFATSERRKLSGLEPQTNLQVESKLSYTFRQIKLTASYFLVKETLTSEKYDYSELRMNVSRKFDVF